MYTEEYFCILCTTYVFYVFKNEKKTTKHKLWITLGASYDVYLRCNELTIDAGQINCTSFVLKIVRLAFSKMTTLIITSDLYISFRVLRLVLSFFLGQLVLTI